MKKKSVILLITFFTLIFVNINANASTSYTIDGDGITTSQRKVNFEPSKMGRAFDDFVRRNFIDNKNNKPKRKIKRPPKPESFSDLRWFSPAE